MQTNKSRGLDDAGWNSENLHDTTYDDDLSSYLTYVMYGPTVKTKTKLQQSVNSYHMYSLDCITLLQSPPQY